MPYFQGVGDEIRGRGNSRWDVIHKRKQRMAKVEELLWPVIIFWSGVTV